MNGLARVGISLLLLGACAVAMRFTMVKMPYPKLYTSETRLGVSPKDKIQLRFEAYDMQGDIEFSQRYARGLRSSLLSNRLNIGTVNLEGNTINGHYVHRFNIQTHPSGNEYQYLFGKPKLDGLLLTQLPPEIPIDINAYAFAPKMNLNFRGLQISKFDLNPDLQSPLPIALDVFAPNQNFEGQVILRTKNSPVELKIPQGCFGTIGLVAEGTSNIELLIEKQVRSTIIIYKSEPIEKISGLWEDVEISESLKNQKTLKFVGINYTANPLKSVKPLSDLYATREPSTDCTIRIFFDSGQGKLAIREVAQL